MQFAGQTHVLTVPIPRADFDARGSAAAFERAYWDRFGVELKRDARARDEPAHRGHRPPPAVSLDGLAATRARGTLADARAGSRRAWFDGAWHDTPIYRREQLAVGAQFDGPAIVEQLDTTTVVEPGDRVEVDAAREPRSSPFEETGDEAIDPVTLVVVQNGLQQVASEMDLTFERAAFSPVISEGFDRSDGIYTKDTGEVIAQGELGLPIFVGVMQFTTHAVIEQCESAARIAEPGDIFIVNDPYCGGTHLMDVKMVKPFFYRGRLWAYLSNTGHWPDTGGSVPGGFSTRATEVQQEGLRLPPVKLFRERRDGRGHPVRSSSPTSACPRSASATSRRRWPR